MIGVSDEIFGISLVLYNIDPFRLKELMVWVDDMISMSYKIAIFWNSEITTSFPEQVLVNSSSGNNKGIGYAHNVNILSLKKSGCKYFMTMDQDSVIDYKSVLCLFGFVSMRKSGVLVGPILYDMKGNMLKGRLFRFKKFLGLTRENDAEKAINHKIIQSGMTGAVKDWEMIGGFNECLFVGEVDFEYCKRFLNARGEIFQLRCASLNQQLGKGRVGIGVFSVVLHDPIRHYYNIRNKLLLVRDGVYGKSVLIRTLFHALAVILLSPLAGKRYRCFDYVFVAVKDGVRGLYGSYSDKQKLKY